MDFDKLVDILACPICQEIALSPIYQCGEGHILCHDCIPLLKDEICPTCRTILPAKKIRSLALEQLSDTIQVKCKNWNKGCHKALPVNGITAHLYNFDCFYEPVNWCQYFGSICKELVPRAQFADHCLTAHKDMTRISDFSVVNDIDIDLHQSASIADMQPGESQTLYWEPSYFVVDNDVQYVLLAKYIASKTRLDWSVVDTLGRADGASVKFTIKSLTSIGDSQDCKYKWLGGCLDFAELREQLKSDETNLNLRVTCCLPVESFLNQNNIIGCKGMLKISARKGVTAIQYKESQNGKLTILVNTRFMHCSGVGNVNVHEAVEYQSANATTVQCDNHCAVCGTEEKREVIYLCAECPQFICRQCATAGRHDQHVMVRMKFAATSTLLRDHEEEGSNLTQAKSDSCFVNVGEKRVKCSVGFEGLDLRRINS